MVETQIHPQPSWANSLLVHHIQFKVLWLAYWKSFFECRSLLGLRNGVLQDCNVHWHIGDLYLMMECVCYKMESWFAANFISFLASDWITSHQLKLKISIRQMDKILLPLQNHGLYWMVFPLTIPGLWSVVLDHISLPSCHFVLYVLYCYLFSSSCQFF